MDRRTTGIIATVIATLACGCPGFFMLCFGAISALVSFTPGADIDIGGSNDPMAALAAGVGGICLGILFILIPIVVGFLTLRNRPAAAPMPVDVYNTPIPPAS